jgi:hypothetical protein
MDCPVTIALVLGHGVRQVLVYCRGKRADNWPCHHPGGALPVGRFGADEALRTLSGDAVAPPAGGGAPTCDPTTACSGHRGLASDG